MDIARESALGEPRGYGGRADRGGLFRRHAERHEADPRHEQIDEQEHDDEGDPYPGDVLDELLQDAVIDDVAGMEGDLDPYGIVAEGRLDRQPEERLLLRVRLQDKEAAQARRSRRAVWSLQAKRPRDRHGGRRWRSGRYWT